MADMVGKRHDNLVCDINKLHEMEQALVAIHKGEPVFRHRVSNLLKAF